MALSFPNSPLTNDIYTYNGKSWQWNGSYWVSINAGVQGAQGLQGIQGAQGIQGIQGVTGSQGTQGTQGVQGIQGLQGITGSTGAQGTVGAQGITGSTGAQGTAGSQGITGSTGAQGAAGSTGAQGITGSTGAQGAAGSTGAQGITGSTGAQGAAGSTGAQGITGSTGAQGAQGTLGTQGTIGTAGPSTSITATNDTSTTALYPVMVGASGSAQTPKTTTGSLSFNAANGYLTCNTVVDSGTNGRIILTGNLHIDAYGSNDIYCNYYSARRFRTFYTSNAESFRADTDGIVYAYSQFRTPFIYDYNDTGYYVNPNSTSNMYAISAYSISGNGNVGGTGNASWHPSGIYSAGFNWLYGGINAGGASVTNMSDARANIFYDYNDTGYYIDPNSTSNSALRMRGGALFGPNPTWGAYLYVGTNGNVSGSATVAVTNGNIHIDTSSSGNPLYLQYYCGGYTEAYGSMRSPIFYDLNNTGYYCDPNSTSNLNALTVNSTFYVNNGWSYVANNYGYGIVGLYNSTIYQLVFAMGDSYKTTAGGGINNLYGMAWSHPNAGGIAGNLDSHGLIVAINGGFGSCMSYSIVASGNVTAYSDERLKKNWKSMPDNFVEKLSRVRVGTYDRMDGECLRQVGVGAQSIREVLPEAVTEAKDDIGTLSVSYGNAALASAVELAKEVVSLKAQLAAVLERLNKLENK